MVSQEFSEAYDRLTKKRELFKKATRTGIFIGRLGAIIFLLGFAWFILIGLLSTVIPAIGRLNIAVWTGIFGLSIMVGTILILFGNNISNRTEYLAPFSYRESAFLKVVDSIKYIDTYQKDGIEQSKIEAVKKLSAVKKNINEPERKYSHKLWGELIAESNDNIFLLKRNFEERLLPSITQGSDEDLKKAYSVIENIAKYLLNPTVSELIGLNKSISELSVYPPKQSRLIHIIGHPNMRHFYFFIFFIILGIIVYRLGIDYVKVSADNAYLAGVGLFGALFAGYMIFMVRKG